MGRGDSFVGLTLAIRLVRAAFALALLMLIFMSMVGVIKTRDVLWNLALIRREFGVRCAVRAVVACVTHRKTTFLQVALGEDLSGGQTSGTPSHQP